MAHGLLIRRLLALLILGCSLALWTTESDLLKLIARQEEILFGRYSRGHFGALLALTPLLWGLAAALWARTTLLRALGNFLLGTASTLVSILLLVYLSSLLAGPARYAETDAAEDERARELELAGVLRHRPPNERYELTWVDEPPQARSYPDAPPGYGAVDIVLTSDERGFRNPNYTGGRPDIVVVGDSFAAGSHVSDDQGWVELLQRRSGQRFYNLGVSGSGPRTYLNNFVYHGIDLAPRQVLFMLYEGNDFKRSVILPPAGARVTAADQAAEPAPPPGLLKRLDRHLSQAMKSSPVTGGLRELSHRVFEPARSDRPVPGYEAAMGFMPVAVTAPDGRLRHYSFKPKRLLSLYHDPEQWAASSIWQATTALLDEFVQRARDHGIEPVFFYAPSKPHVVLPLVADEDLPAEQLWQFARHDRRSLPEPELFKKEIMQRLDSQASVFMDWCRDRDQRCLDLTPALTRATAAGIQTYFTYDQHWSPDGNRVVADAIEAFLAAPQQD